MSSSSNNDGNRNTDISNELQRRQELFAKLVAEQKKQMLGVEKEKLIDIIFNQNTLLTQQSNQMIDLVNLINDMDVDGTSGSPGSGQISNDPSDIQRSIDVLRKRNDLCVEANNLRKKSAVLFSSSVRIQFVLFVLFIMVLLWLFYHFSTFKAD